MLQLLNVITWKSSTTNFPHIIKEIWKIRIEV